MSDELVSIVVPVYNVEKYVRRCLESISKQTYSEIEVIIINDGSTDNSENIIKDFLFDKRFKYIVQKNSGLGSARNKGIENSKGKYICFIDSDDWISADYVSKMVDILRNEQSDISICNMCYIFSNGKLKRRIPKIKKREIIDSRNALIELFLGKKFKFHAQNKMYKKELFINNNILFAEGKIYEDVSTTYKLINSANKISLLPDNLYFYLQARQGSIMNNSINEKRFDDMYSALDEIYEYCINNELDLTEEYGCLYAINVISLINYIVPYIDNSDIANRYINIIKDHKAYYLLNESIKSHKLSIINKLRIFMLIKNMHFYCKLIKYVKKW